MRFYAATTFLFPRSYERRILFICFGAVHIPLISCIVFQAITGNWEPATLLLLLVATLVGTVLGLAAIHALLAPVATATGMLQAIQNGERLSFVPAGNDDLVGRLLHGVAIAANESAARMEQLADVAERDPLTGIRNRRGFLDTARHKLRDGTNSAIGLIDVDHFKSINDDLGHAAGDHLLKVLAHRIERDLRRADLAARWGGEEFVVLLPDSSLDEAREVIDRLRAGIAHDTGLGVSDRRVTFSCGLAPVRTFAQLETALRSADKALYAAKDAGRNRVAVAG